MDKVLDSVKDLSMDELESFRRETISGVIYGDGTSLDWSEGTVATAYRESGVGYLHPRYIPVGQEEFLDEMTRALQRRKLQLEAKKRSDAVGESLVKALAAVSTAEVEQRGLTKAETADVARSNDKDLLSAVRGFNCSWGNWASVEQEAVRTKKWLSFRLEMQAAEKQQTKQAWRQAIDRIEKCRKMHGTNHVESGNSRCELCAILRWSLKEAVSGRKSAPAKVTSGSKKEPEEEKPQPNSAARRKERRSGKAEAPKETVEGMKVLDALDFSAVDVLTREDVKLLEVPKLSECSGYVDYGKQVILHLRLKSQMLREIEKREKKRSEERAPKTKEPVTKPKELPKEKVEAIAKTKSEQAKASKRAKEQRRKARKSAEKLARSQTELAVLKTERAVEVEKQKVRKVVKKNREARLAAKAKEMNKEVELEPSQKLRAAKLKANQAKRARQKRALLKKRAAESAEEGNY